MAFSNLVLPNVAPVQQGGPLVNAMQGVNSLVNNMANTQTAQAQAQYAPYNAYSTAALNMAQANMLPYTVQSQQYNNPMMWMAMQQLKQTDPGAYQNYMNGMANFGKNMSNMMSNMPQGNSLFGNMPPPGQGVSNPLSLLYNKIFGGSQSNNAMATNPGQASSSNAPNQASTQATANNDSQSIKPPAALPGVEDNPWYQNQQGISTSTAQGQANVDQLKQMNDKDIATATASQKAVNDAGRYTHAFSQLGPYEKGPVFGHGPAMTTASQIADQSVASMRANILNSQQSGNLSDKDVDIFGTLIKPSRTNTDTATKDIVNYMDGVNLRNQEKLAFNNAANNLGLTAPQQALLWNKYINDRPFFNVDTHELIQGNLSTWPDYLRKNKATEILDNAPKEVSQPPASSGTTADQLRNSSSAQNNGIAEVPATTAKQAVTNSANQYKNQTIQMKDSKGNLWNVPVGKAQKFLDNNFTRDG